MTESQRSDIKPDIKFFVEKPKESLTIPRPEALKELLNDEVCDFLATRKWGISLATIDLDEPTAKVIQRINKNFPSLPFVMWLTLPDEKGYWTNESNVQETKNLAKNVENWINQYKIENAIAGFGFDIEPNIDFVREADKEGISHLALTLMKRKFALKRSQKKNFREELTSLIKDVRDRGIPTEAYVNAGLTSFIYSVPRTTNADYNFVILYSSFYKDPLAKAIPQYFKYFLGKNEYPALGNFTDEIEKHDGRRITLHDEEYMATPEKLQRDILSLVKGENSLERFIDLSRGDQTKEKNYLDKLRIFALTGPPILIATDKALKEAKTMARKRNSSFLRR